MRKVIKISVLVFLGIFIGSIAYEAIMFIRVWHLRSTNPYSTSLIDAREQETEAKGQQPRREQVWVPLNRISPNLQRAVLAGEDTNFVTHHGFDYEALQKAWDEGMRDATREAKKEGENDDWLPTLPDFKRGASTISQQLAKNLYLSSRRSFFRKGQEAMLTIFLERTLSKPRILEIYLNVIEWGDGIYGAEAAAQHYFHKPASVLSASEAAYLSAMIPNPRTVFNPQVNPRRVSRRQRIILRGMPYVRIP
jgi:monofunctional biosynthetic peptidoglycan transglycosylase